MPGVRRRPLECLSAARALRAWPTHPGAQSLDSHGGDLLVVRRGRGGGIVGERASLRAAFPGPAVRGRWPGRPSARRPRPGRPAVRRPCPGRPAAGRFGVGVRRRSVRGSPPATRGRAFTPGRRLRGEFGDCDRGSSAVGSALVVPRTRVVAAGGPPPRPWTYQGRRGGGPPSAAGEGAHAGTTDPSGSNYLLNTPRPKRSAACVPSPGLPTCRSKVLHHLSPSCPATGT